MQVTRKQALEQGLMHYHGASCKRCDRVLRYVADYHCVHCKKTSELNKRYPGYRNAKEGRRREGAVSSVLSIIHRTEIREVYKDAQIKTMITGVAHQVDHIIPLNHPDVCGLHVPANLCILTANDNREKSNSFDPDQQRVDGPICIAFEEQVLYRLREHADERVA